MRLYLCRQDEKTLLFKEINDSKIIQYELLVQKLAEKLSVRTLKLYSIQGKGILMDYHKDSILLCNYRHGLNPTQKRGLQRIVLLDLLIGNKDRHTANMFVNEHLTAFDHDKILRDIARPSSAFVKLDVGKKLDTDYLEKVEQILQKGNISTKTALLEYFGFNEEDIAMIKTLQDKEIALIVNSLRFSESEKKRIISFLIYRRDNFDCSNWVHTP